MCLTQGMSKLVDAIRGGVVQLSLELQSSLFTSHAFAILLRHFARELEPLLQAGRPRLHRQRSCLPV